MADFLKTSGDISTICWLISIALIAISSAATGYRLARFRYRRDKYLFTNLKRPILVIEPTDAHDNKLGSVELEEVKSMIRDNEFLRLDEGAVSYKSFNPHNGHCLVVLGYSEGMAGLDEILDKVKALQIPLIVYTYGKHLASDAEKADKRSLDSYPWTNYGNSRTALLNTVFGTLASWPYYLNKKK